MIIWVYGHLKSLYKSVQSFREWGAANCHAWSLPCFCVLCFKIVVICCYLCLLSKCTLVWVKRVTAALNLTPCSLSQAIEFGELDKPKVKFLRQVLTKLLKETEPEDLVNIFGRYWSHFYFIFQSSFYLILNLVLNWTTNTIMLAWSNFRQNRLPPVLAGLAQWMDCRAGHQQRVLVIPATAACRHGHRITSLIVFCLSRISGMPKLGMLREGLKLFISHFLLKNAQSLGNAEQATLLTERAEVATKAMEAREAKLKL